MTNPPLISADIPIARALITELSNAHGWKYEDVIKELNINYSYRPEWQVYERTYFMDRIEKILPLLIFQGFINVIKGNISINKKKPLKQMKKILGDDFDGKHYRTNRRN